MFVLSAQVQSKQFNWKSVEIPVGGRIRPAPGPLEPLHTS